MRSDWWSCDGGEAGGQRPVAEQAPATGLFSLSRRQALVGAATALVGWLARERTALADLAVTPGRAEPQGDVLVTLFLRGGADGLNIVVPHGEDAYHRHRPTIGIASPKRGVRDAAIDLDGFFGLHPSLAPLAPLYHEGMLACVHACGSGDQTRSHFEAMAAMERGQPDEQTGTASGWLARHLDSTRRDVGSPLRAVAFSSVMPDSLRGATDATALNSLAEFRLVVPGSTARGREAELRGALGELYREGGDAVARAGRETLAVLETLDRLDPDRYRPANGAVYPASELGTAFRQVACLIRGRVGLEAACLDRGGWDTHVAQGSAGGWLASQLDDVARSMAAFARDLGPEMRRVTVIAMTEFGRRLQENSGLGTDHGRGGALFLLGGGIAGGKVYARWPGLEDRQLEPPGDLRVTTDYRDVLGEIVARRLRNAELARVFPDYTPRFVGVTKG